MARGLSEAKDMQFKLVIVVREDLKISPGKMAAQVGHAAVSCALKVKEKDRKIFSKWMDEGQRKVVLRIGSLSELDRIERMADAASLITSRIVDAGLTEVPPGTVTCLGIGPSREADVDRITGNLKLV